MFTHKLQDSSVKKGHVKKLIVFSAGVVIEQQDGRTVNQVTSCYLFRVNYVKNMSSITHHAAPFHIDCNNLSLQFLNHICPGAKSC